MKRFIALLVVPFLLIATLPSAQAASDYPTRTVKILVGFPPGGGTDLVARVLAQGLSDHFGKPFIVENRPGATGTIAAQVEAAAAPDGDTLMLGHVNSLATAPSVFKHLAYDPHRDFTPIVYVGYVPNILVVNAAMPVKSVADLVAYIKASHSQISFASAGIGSTQQIAAELFKRQAGLSMVHVPFRGTGPAVTALLSGVVTMSFETFPGVIGLIHAGKLRPLAVAGPTRLDALPDVPTMHELGYNVEVTNWYGLVGPAKLSPAIVQSLNAAVNELLGQASVKARLEKAGGVLSGGTPAQFATLIAEQTRQIAGVVHDAGISIN
jgi:tripartite-type tricarboxylate transporter receptor subunit TctC